MTDIVSLDPGVNVGICTLTGEDYYQFETRPEKYPHPHESLFDILTELAPKLIIYERFHSRQNQDNAEFKGIEYIGVIELYAQMKCVETVLMNPQKGQRGKTFWDDHKIKALGLWIPGKGHAMDATRLLLTHQMKNKEFERRILWVLKDIL